MQKAQSNPIKLNQSNLHIIASRVQSPAYDRTRIRQSIVHIGVGGFHRAHQAVYLDDLMQQPGQTGWGICGVGLLRQDYRMRDALQPQDCLYTVVETSRAGDSARVICSLTEFLYAPENSQAVVEKMAASECRIVSLTITEGGYYFNQGTGEFDDSHPDILHDLDHPHDPSCSFGYLAEALGRRRQRGLPPFTVMSCDNLQQNGDVTRRMILAFADLRDPALSKWIAQNCAFPNSMVDRITPVTTDEHRSMVREKFGIDDAWPVITEPFRQWVIEDRFSNGRPAWERVGAQMTTDVLPYEKMKIRLLNASHQAMCYVGLLIGYEYVHEAIADRHIRKLVQDLMDLEVSPLLPATPGIDLEEYKKTLIERFANPAIKDQLSRIGVEASARIPKFVLPSILEQLACGGPIKMLSLVLATWFRYLSGYDEQGRAMVIIDPLADKLRELARRGAADPGPLLSVKELFGEILSKSQPLYSQVSHALRSLYEKGARATLEAYLVR
jgi:mannitol 2-dehydrogenase